MHRPNEVSFTVPDDIGFSRFILLKEQREPVQYPLYIEA